MSDPSNSPLNVLIVGMGQVAQAILDMLVTPHYKRRVHSFLLVPRVLQLDEQSQERVEQYKTQQVHTLEGEVTSAAVEYLSDLFQLHKIDTVVSCLGLQQAELQHSLIDAARHGGVNHFIPADFEFGLDYDAMAEDDPLYELMGHTRRAVHSAARESGMDWTFIACGAFAEQLLTSEDFGVDLPSRTIRVPQALEVRITYAALKDVGQLTAMAIVDSSTRNKQLRVGRIATTQHVIDALNKHRPADSQWTIEQLTDEQLQQQVDSDAKRVFPRLALSRARGSKATVWDEEHTWKNDEFKYTDLEAVAAVVLPNKADEKKDDKNK